MFIYLGEVCWVVLLAELAVNNTVINPPSGWLSSVGAEASGLSEVLALSILDPCVESLLHPSTFYTTRTLGRS